jgi:hypothetical protein
MEGDKKEINLIAICTDIATLKEFKTNTETSVKSMQNDIRDIKEQLLGRPTWAVLMIITFLTTVCAGCIVKLVS